MRNEIRRELQRRRKAINVAKGRVAKKSSARPPLPPQRLIPSVSTLKLANAPPREGAATRKCSAPPPRPRVLIPAAAAAATRKIAYLDMGEAPRRCTAPPRREALIPFAPKAAKSYTTKAHAASSHETAGAETEYVKKPPSSATPIQSISVKKGTTVKVRVPAGTLPTGQRLVIWHPAVVVSDVEGGYVEVIYKGNYPRDQTSVRVALDQVKSMPSTK
jgi:hypothetical protein